jgi:hypothetical protein
MSLKPAGLLGGAALLLPGLGDSFGMGLARALRAGLVAAGGDQGRGVGLWIEGCGEMPTLAQGQPRFRVCPLCWRGGATRPGAGGLLLSARKRRDMKPLFAGSSI